VRIYVTKKKTKRKETLNKKQAMTEKKTISLGPYGYCLLKKEWTRDEIDEMKKDLTVFPKTLMDMQKSFSFKDFSDHFFVFRESVSKLYLPRFYGIQKFGVPERNTIFPGEKCEKEAEFHGTLRDYQVPVIEKFLTRIQECGGCGLLELPCGWGKTSAALYIFSQLKLKTLVIVHKEFLMNQWVERIQQFLPKVRIGKIQRNVMDVEGKDIVLCMLQSLVLKDYPKELFQSFGFTIVDEVHHIASEMFSQSLFKIVTRYMLGLSATMERKDGTTHVFKWFLGDVIHQVKTQKEQQQRVQVRSVTFKDDDPEFNAVIADYKGNVQNSSMISKLCNYSRRTEFIISLLCAFLQKNEASNSALVDEVSKPCCGQCGRNIHYLVKNTCCNLVKYCLVCAKQEKQKGKKCPDCQKRWQFEQHYIPNPSLKPIEECHVIVMAHNLNLLHYIYDKFVCFNLASVSFYVGGMKEAELKKSEKAQVILATYSMSQEGLDIPSLNAEFLITPKTDIQQSVGRILRAKHSVHSGPVIYDIVDPHAVFQRQYAKRRNFYKRMGYEIVTASKIGSTNAITEWKSSTNQNKKILKKEEDEEDEDEDDEETTPVVTTCFFNTMHKKKENNPF